MLESSLGQLENVKKNQENILKERESLKNELARFKEENERKRIDMDTDWEHEQTIIREKHDMLKQKLQEAKDKNRVLLDEKKIHDVQVQSQAFEKAKLIEENKKAKIEFLKNEDNMIEY